MRIACVLAEGFEDSEFKKPYDEFRKAGHEVVVIGADKGKTLAGKAGKEKAKVDLAITEATPESFDALFIPGGHSPDQLRADDRFVQFAKAFEHKPIFAICHGPQLLLTADMVRGREMTAWKTVQVDLRYAGAHVMDEEVVVDDNVVTSRQPSDLPVFVKSALELMQGGAEAHAPH
ncbi:MAG TPA: type 1 glutamine amidotransferase domain-containing protein [Polyangia bacterium]|nr:type 1 glutamine amidotransferase domain-containing protein [Polyangia bacterium]